MTMNATKMTPMTEMIMEKMMLEKMENAMEEKVTQASVKKNPPAADKILSTKLINIQV